MAHYICPKCQTVFTEPFREHYDDGFLKESYDTCPTCGNLDFEPAIKCKGCGEWMEFGKLIGGYYCSACVQQAMDQEHIAAGFLNEDDVRESFAEFLAEIQWEPDKEARV